MRKAASLVTRDPIVAGRVRSIGGMGFSFVPHRFLREGFFASLTPEELLLYFLLVLASDRYGVSFYHYDTLSSLLQMPVDTFLEARKGLIEKDLIAFDGRRYQVLSLPRKPVQSPSRPLGPDDFEHEDAATVRQMARRSLGME